MAGQLLKDEPAEGVLRLTISNPDKRGALDHAILDAVTEQVTGAAATGARCILLTGEGRWFSSGYDIGDIPADVFAVEAERIVAHPFTEALQALDATDLPTVAAINGPAIGGGLCMALAADIRIASTQAYFRAAGINTGLTASELGLSYLLPRAIGSSRAFEIMLTGRDVDADEAERIGLVSRKVPADELLDSCYQIGEQIAAFSRPGIELTKRTLWTGLDAGSLEGHMQAEGLGQLFVRLLTANFEEAVAARSEKRTPIFTDDK